MSQKSINNIDEKVIKDLKPLRVSSKSVKKVALLMNIRVICLKKNVKREKNVFIEIDKNIALLMNILVVSKTNAKSIKHITCFSSKSINIALKPTL